MKTEPQHGWWAAERGEGAAAARSVPASTCLPAAERPWDDRSNDRPDGGRSQASKQGRKGHTECVHAEAASGGRQQKNTKPPSLRVVTLDVFLFVSFSLFAAT